MNHRKIILGLFVATLGASFVHQASAQWGTGGATSIPRKSHLSNYNLFCDMSRVSFGGYTIPAVDRVKITTTPSATNPTPPTTGPSLRFEGQMFCAEVDPNAPGANPPSLEKAVEVSPGNKLVGRFTLTQRSPAQRATSTLTQTETGLQFVFDSETGVRTWTFFVPDPTPFPFPELLYDLVPAETTTAGKFCEPSATPCKLLIGLQLPAKQADYQPRDIDGLSPSPDLTLGQVFKFTTKTTGGVEAPGQFFWGPCRSDAFGKPTTVDVDAQLNGSHGLVGAGAATGIILPSTQVRLAVTVNQNDLWNSGALTPAGRWSNADGQVHNMTSTGHDDSGTAVGTAIGTDRFYGELAADAGHLLYAWNGSSWVPAGSAPWGVLVGSTDGANFFIFGTAFDGLSPPVTGELKLYYWDTPLSDNTEFVTVTVATESIQCTDNLGPKTVLGNARGERPVEVATLQQTLNVKNTSSQAAFPLAILGCNVGDSAITFGPNGSPIVLGTTVLVNGKPVDIKNSNVADVVSRPACDSGQALADLKLGLNQLQFIRAVAPGGQCQNGPIGYSITLGNKTDGFYGGQSTVTLNKCN